MDSLYNSVKFAKAFYQHPKKVQVYGVIWEGGRGLPDAVKQEEVTAKKGQTQVRGTVKAAVLEGDPDCPNIVVSSVYDTKPVHFISTSTEEITWTKIEKP
eukprot:9001642-Ditylum_brightwellii.AAC.1